MQGPITSIGVDVSKDELWIAVEGAQGRARSIRNTAGSIRRWLATLEGAHRIAMESTGRYWYLLAELADAAGYPVYVLNPRDLRHYAQALGVRGKTDRVDSQCIARYLDREHERLHVWRRPTAAQRQLGTLLRRRATVMNHRTALRMSLSDVAALRAATERAMAAFDELLEAIDRSIDETLQAEPALVQGVRRLLSIDGIGRQNATSLAELFERIPFDTSDAVVAFVGLDPRARDSGRKRGRRTLSKRGPPRLRQLLYIAAMSACKNATWRPHYERLRAGGLAGTAACVALARKMLRVAFAVWRSGQPFDAARIRVEHRVT